MSMHWRDFVHISICVLALFSGLSNLVFDFDGLYIFELAILVVVIYSVFFPNLFSESIKFAIVDRDSNVFFLAALLLFLLIIGGVVGGDFANAYTDFRANLVVVVGYCFSISAFKRGKWEVVAVSALIAGLGSILHWVYVLNYAVLDYKFSVPILSCVVATLLYRDNSRQGMAYISFALLIAMSAIAFYRQYWLYVMVIIFLFAIDSRKSTVNRKNYLPFLLVIFSPLLVLGYEVFFNLVADNESLYIQSFGKTQDLLDFFSGSSGLTESDAIRLAYFEYLLTHFYEVVLPHGLGYKSFFDNVSPWFYQYSIEANTIDSLLFYLTFHYGLVFVLPLFIFFLRKLYLNSTFSFWEKLFLFSMVLNIMFFDGGLATVISRSFWLGVYFAYFSYDRNARKRAEVA